MTCRFCLGHAQVDAVVDIEQFRLPFARLLPGSSPEAVEEWRDVLAPDHVDFTSAELIIGIQTFVIRKDGLTIVVDTCVGEHKERPARPDWHRRDATGFLQRLAAIGVEPESVDVVLCTHLHADHVGWNTRLHNGRWVPTFPNAQYLVGSSELAHWQHARETSTTPVNHGAYEDSVLPIIESRQMSTVDDGHEIGHGLTLTPLPGHTVGQMGLRLHSAQTHALFCGDAIHSPVQIYRPEWSSAFCHSGEVAHATRLGVLEEAATSGLTLVPAHFRGSRRVQIARRGEQFYPQFG